MTRSATLRRLPLLFGGVAAIVLPGCDSPACVFGTSGCQSGPTAGAGAGEVVFPETGEWVLPGAPKVDSVLPQGNANPESPVVVIFNESMAPATVQNAFEVRQVGGGGFGGGGTTGVLVGDGRMLVLFPPPMVAGSEYEVAYADGAVVHDLTGTLATRPKGGVVGTFSVVESTSSDPKLVATWPADGAQWQSTISEIVTVFDRPIDPSSVTLDSWFVRVGTNPPPFDPPPEMLTLGIGPSQTQESRVWTWASVDPDTTRRADLGAGEIVYLNLSPNGNEITTPDGGVLAAGTVQFTTGLVSAPLEARIISEPTDAIGIENLNGVAPLLMEVEFVGEIAGGDVLEMLIFGTHPVPVTSDGEETFVLTVELRELVLEAGTAIALLRETDLQLLLSVAPLQARFRDGDLSFAFYLRRGTDVTAAQVLDVDPDVPGLQDPVLDTVPPEFLGLTGVIDSPSDYRSDVRDLIVIGEASEELSTVEVIANLASGPVDNRIGGALPPLPAMSGTSFVAAAVGVGQIDLAELPVDFSVIVYDRALNAAPAFLAQYTQIGASGPGAALLGSGLDVDVAVYDASTRQPIQGATVYAHESVGDALTAFAAQPVSTDAAGRAQIASAPTGDTLITVEASGYDLYTFHGVPTTRLDVMLAPESLSLSAAKPAVIGTGEGLSSSLIDTWLADSRGILPGETVQQGTTCIYNPLTNETVCTFDPVPIIARRGGLITFLATKEPADLIDPNAFSAASFLQGFALDFPRPPIAPGGLDTPLIRVPSLLSGADVDPEDIPLGTPPLVLEKSPDYATAFANAVGDPRVAVEVLVGGLPGAATVGLGRPYYNGITDRWDIRAAYSALAKAGGVLVEDGAIEDERFLRLEFVDLSEARSGRRARLSGAPASVVPPAIPVLSSPSGSVSGRAYDLVWGDVFTGAVDAKGLYRVVLVDQNGKRWRVWRVDPPDAGGTATSHLPPIELAGGVPLADGSVICTVAGWAWPGLDVLEFMWTDVDREHDHFVTSAPVVFVQGP